MLRHSLPECFSRLFSLNQWPWILMQCFQLFFLGSTIIISSPVQPMLQNVMVPVSVVGQNTGKLTVVPNQVSHI